MRFGPLPPTLLLDDYGDGALLAVSMRKLRTAYNGFSMRIQRRGIAGSTGTADDQADLHFDDNNYTSLDSPITAVTAGVLSTTLGEFCDAPGYSNPDSMPSADSVEVVKFYNQTEDTTITEFSQGAVGQYNELVTNGVLETITIGGNPFVALNVGWRESYFAIVSGLATPLTTFTVTNVKDPAGAFTTEGVSLTPSAYSAESAVVRYDDTTELCRKIHIEFDRLENLKNIKTNIHIGIFECPPIFIIKHNLRKRPSYVPSQDEADNVIFQINQVNQLVRLFNFKFDFNAPRLAIDFMRRRIKKGNQGIGPLQNQCR